jgi:hypothetical protein
MISCQPIINRVWFRFRQTHQNSIERRIMVASHLIHAQTNERERDAYIAAGCELESMDAGRPGVTVRRLRPAP